MESDDFTRHYIIRYLSARELVLPPLVVAVRCEERHFLILYACAHEVSFPGQIPRSLVWERHLVHKGATRAAGTVSSRSSGQSL